MKTLAWTALLALALTSASTIHAQCASAAQPNCAVYASCFAKQCPCTGDANEYFISYGEKYCRRFLGDDNFSDVGKAWRDATLVCLQEKIVPKLDLSATPTCNCATMRAFAFD